MAGRGDTRYKALDHPIRRKIVQLLAEEPQTYSNILAKLEIESGHLAYHIRNLAELVEKDEFGNYRLNSEGAEAYMFLTGEKQVQIEPASENKVMLFVFLLIFILFIAIIVSAPIMSDDQRFNRLRDETLNLNLEALDTVYEIFEDWEIPRDHWTELLLNIVKIRDNLEELDELCEEERLETLVEDLVIYEDELSNVIIVGDPGYMSLTVEKRYLIRDLHTVLLEIDDVLSGL